MTSSPSRVTTRLPWRSAGGRGVGRPPICSGQIGMQVWVLSNSFSWGSWLWPPSYRQPTPSRQALTSSFMAAPSLAQGLGPGGLLEAHQHLAVVQD